MKACPFLIELPKNHEIPRNFVQDLLFHGRSTVPQKFTEKEEH